MAIYNEDTGTWTISDADNNSSYEAVQSEDEGGGWLQIGSDAYNREQYVAPSVANYDSAKNIYSSGKVPWNWNSLYGNDEYGSDYTQGGLSSREAFNLNALWGATQYAQGRVTDFSHIDPTQLEANKIAGETRDQLWNEYNKLVAAGTPPAKNPDEVALDFYVKNVGQNGSSFGYGPGINTALLSEALKNTFLNQPEVISARGTRYVTTQAQIDAANEFGSAHEAGVPIWQIFEQQGVSSGGFGRFIPLIIGAIAFPGMGAALANVLGGTVAANIAAAAIIGGVNAEINGGDFIDGAIKSALTAGTGAAIADVGVAAEVSSALESIGIDANIANSVANTAERAITSAIVAEATGGDAGDAILNTLVAAGVSAVRSEVTEIAESLTAGEAPADIEDAELGDAMTEAAAPFQETDIAATQQPEDVPRETLEDDLREQELATAIVDDVSEPSFAEVAPVEIDFAAEEEALSPEEPLPEEKPIPEAMPEVEPEPVLPEEGRLDDEAAPEDEAIGDREVLDALVEEDTGEDAELEEDMEEEMAPEEQEVLPAEEPTEETPEEEPGTEPQPTEGPSSLDRLIASLLLNEQGGQGVRVSAPRRSVTQESVSPREISGSVTGIIGKKQPMFGGDEDEQSAEWNRRSLRLRKVLGL